jgi:predicted phosphodiesterase
VRVAALYDIHGNLPALRAALADIRCADVTDVVIGGDVVPGPLPRETIELLTSVAWRVHLVRGNGERETVDAYDGGASAEHEADPAARAAAFTASRITREQRDFLAGFEEHLVLELDALGPALFCHGSPRSDTEELTTATSEKRMRGILASVDQSLVVCGHTHRQFDRRIDGRRVINAGSVGMPYEGRVGAFWALLGPAVELRFTAYDVEDALAEMRAGGFADLEEMLHESLLEPMDPDEVAAIFERQALARREVPACDQDDAPA